MLHVSRALELQIGLYRASCRAFTEFRAELRVKLRVELRVKLRVALW